MPRDALILTHGAGGNRESPLLLAVSSAFEQAGYLVERLNLPFRERRPKGPPRPSEAAGDREGLRLAVRAMRQRVCGKVLLGGQSYGGRQASILAAEEAGLADGLLLLSYPLHPPGKPERPRADHFPQLTAPALFVLGARDPFGSPEELERARKLLRSRNAVIVIEKAGHDLRKGAGWDQSQLVSFFGEDRPGGSG